MNKHEEQSDAFFETLKEKYKDRPAFGWNNFPITASGILCGDLIKQRLNNNQPVNLYVLAILCMLSDGMGLRVRWEHGGTLYDQLSPFKYPEELYEVLSAMYDIISEKIEKNESMRFILYEYGGVNDEYQDFIDEIARRTRYSSSMFGSKLKDQITSEAYHGENYGFSQKRKELSLMKPCIIISPASATYYHDMASDNALVETTSPEKSKKDFGWVIGLKNENVSTQGHFENLSQEKTPSFGKGEDATTLTKKESVDKDIIIKHCEVLQTLKNGISVNVDGEIGHLGIFYNGIDYSKFYVGQRIVIAEDVGRIIFYDESEYEIKGEAAKVLAATATDIPKRVIEETAPQHGKVNEVSKDAISIIVDGESGLCHIDNEGIDYSKFYVGQRVVIDYSHGSAAVYDEYLYNRRERRREESVLFAQAIIDALKENDTYSSKK